MKTHGSHEKNESEGDVQIEEDKIKSKHCSFLSHPPTILSKCQTSKGQTYATFLIAPF